MKQKTNWYYILGTIVLCCSIASLFIACNSNKFELETTIYPSINYSSEVSVEFRLGDLLILDEWTGLNSAQTLFVINKEKMKNGVYLKITAGDFDGVKFLYIIEGSIQVTTTPVDWKTIKRHIDSFPNVVWKVKDQRTIAEKDQKPEDAKEDDLKSTENDSDDKLEELKL